MCCYIRSNGVLTSLNISTNNIGALVLPDGWTEENDEMVSNEYSSYRHTDGREQEEHPGKPEGVTALADAIKTNGALVKVNISANAIASKEAGKALAEALKNNTVLKELDVSDNLQKDWRGDVSGAQADRPASS